MRESFNKKQSAPMSRNIRKVIGKFVSPMVNCMAQNANGTKDCRVFTLQQHLWRVHYVTSSLIMCYMTSELITRYLK